jgi:hypothetical protein
MKYPPAPSPPVVDIIEPITAIRPRTAASVASCSASSPPWAISTEYFPRIVLFGFSW